MTIGVTHCKCSQALGLHHNSACPLGGIVTSTNIMGFISPWHPITDAVDLKHLGKLGEETGELSAAVSRCIIQGVDEAEPVTGKVNREWLEDEIADVLANSNLVVERFNLDKRRIHDRAQRKMADLRRWHEGA